MNRRQGFFDVVDSCYTSETIEWSGITFQVFFRLIIQPGKPDWIYGSVLFSLGYAVNIALKRV